jgi:hypothetical protein
MWGATREAAFRWTRQRSTCVGNKSGPSGSARVAGGATSGKHGRDEIHRVQTRRWPRLCTLAVGAFCLTDCDNIAAGLCKHS